MSLQIFYDKYVIYSGNILVANKQRCFACPMAICC